MRNPILSAVCVAVAGMLILGPTLVSAQSYQAHLNIKGVKQGNMNTATPRLTVRKAGEQPKEYLTTTQNKPLNPTVNPAAKGGGSNAPSLYKNTTTGVHYNNATINLR